MDYSYIREAFDKKNSNNYVLSIQIDSDGFSFYVAEKESINKPLNFLFRRFEKPGIAYLIKELNDFQEYDNIAFYKTIIIYHTDKFCLVPDELYNPENQSYYLRLNHQLPDKISFYSFDIQEIKANVLYCLPEDLNSLINLKFPNAILLHSACPALNFGIKKSGKTCIIYNYGTSISIAVFDRKELKLFNVFSVSNMNDLVYYILNVLKSCNQNVAETTFYLSGEIEKNSEEFIFLSKYIINPVCYIPELEEVNTSDFPVNMVFNHLEALYCVL